MTGRFAVGLCFVVLLAGCGEPPSGNSNGKQEPSNPPLAGDGSGAADDTSESAPPSHSHVIAGDSQYYTTGPQQGRPPHGTFAAGTRVTVLQEAGSYWLVRSEQGIEAYVAADALRPAASSPGNSAESPNREATMDISGIVQGGNRFALEMYDRLRAEQGNLFFSPASITTALAMTFAGAAGETEAEMARVLHFDAPQEQLHDGMRSLQSSWKTGDAKAGFRLHLANRLWGQQEYEFLPAFLDVTRTHYGAECARLDFAAEPEPARLSINDWVQKQTEGKISDLIPPGMLSSDTRLVLTNAVYFKGGWTEPFNAERTKVEDFHRTADDTVQAPLMHKQDRFRYAQIDELQLLELPYGDKSLSMLVLLPAAVDGLADLEAKLTPENLQRWTAGMRSQEVRVALPKFKMTTQFEMSGMLRLMGITSAFDPQSADFSGMTGGRDLFISAAIHKAYVDVNEEGTEAAAATGVAVGVTAIPVEPAEPPVFRADHPFVFLIRDNRNGALLFLGRLADPHQ